MCPRKMAHSIYKQAISARATEKGWGKTVFTPYHRQSTTYLSHCLSLAGSQQSFCCSNSQRKRKQWNYILPSCVTDWECLQLQISCTVFGPDIDHACTLTTVQRQLSIKTKSNSALHIAKQCHLTLKKTLQYTVFTKAHAKQRQPVFAQTHHTDTELALWRPRIRQTPTHTHHLTNTSEHYSATVVRWRMVRHRQICGDVFTAGSKIWDWSTPQTWWTTAKPSWHDTFLQTKISLSNIVTICRQWDKIAPQ